MMQLAMRRCQPSESRAAKDWIAARHYTKTAPPGFRLVLEFSAANVIMGAILLGRPTSRELDPEAWVEVTRMFFLNDAPKNSESHALGMMRRYVRVWMPQVRGLIAYSDPSVGHDGTVYVADGWACFGRTQSRNKPWRNRPGRKDTHSPASKLRWVRTP